MAGISSKAINTLDNKYEYNGNEKQDKEFSDASGLESMDFNARMYDEHIGRFWQQDPMGDEFERLSLYAFANDNPILLNDPSGLASDTMNASQHLEVTVTATKKSNGSSLLGVSPSLNSALIGFAPAIPLDGISIGTGAGVSATTATGVGTAVIGLVVVNELARKATKERWYITYYKVGRNGKIYVGRCSGFGSNPEEVLEKYDKTHRMNSLNYGPAVIDKALPGSVFLTGLASDGIGSLGVAEISGYAATRGREQQLYDDFKKKGFTMGNSINPVWKHNPLGPTYWVASTAAFGPLQSYRATY